MSSLTGSINGPMSTVFLEPSSWAELTVRVVSPTCAKVRLFAFPGRPRPSETAVVQSPEPSPQAGVQKYTYELCVKGTVSDADCQRLLDRVDQAIARQFPNAELG